MATGVASWSKTAASNANSDANVNWAEGMTAGAVNNSSRAEMASVAMWRDDNAGMITTGGSSTAYTATSNQSLGLVNGQTITLIIHATSGATPTLNVDGGGAKALQTLSGTALPTASLVANGIYTFTYLTGPDAWVARGRYAPNEFAAGVKMLFYADTAPTGWTTITASIDNKALRIVSGSGAGGGTGGATGGSTAFTSVFAARTITASNIPDLTITITDPGHFHSEEGVASGGGTVGGGSDGNEYYPASNSTGSKTTGITAAFGTTARGGAQTAVDFAVAYASVIAATKD